MNHVETSMSVVCPAYNSAGFITETLQSISTQTCLPFEVVVSDDGSTDDTVATVEQFAKKNPHLKIVVLKNAHKGPGAARNAAIRAAGGAWIAFLDSDDRWKPEKVTRVAMAIQDHPDINFFCHDQYHRFLDGRDEPLNLARRYQGMMVSRQIFRNCPFATSAVVCRKNVLMEHGLFNEQLMSAQDYELWLRISPFLHVYFIDEPLGWYIDRKENISSKKRWRHLQNVLIALSVNRKNTKMRWYVAGVARHLAVFCKNQLLKVLAKS